MTMTMPHPSQLPVAWNPAAVLSCAGVLVAYLLLFGWNRRLGWLAAALGVALLALVSPINALADGYLFSAHMLQHILLLLVTPALFMLSLPAGVSLAAGPRLLRHPLLGWASGVGAMWFWHERTLCNAAVSSAPVHAVQTVSLLLLGGLFWCQILAPRQEERLSPPSAVLYLLAACFACSVLGIIITLSPVAVCSIYTMPPPDHLALLQSIRSNWGLTVERDQQLGGLLMWVPMCLVYLGAICAQLARWFGQPASSATVGTL